MKKVTYTSIDTYIKTFPEEVQKILEAVRRTIQKAAPGAKEKIGYGIPTFTYHGNLVHFGGAQKHIGFYPGSGPILAFADDLRGYDTSKGTVRFPLDKPIPYDLIEKITKFCVERNLENKKSLR